MPLIMAPTNVEMSIKKISAEEKTKKKNLQKGRSREGRAREGKRVSLSKYHNLLEIP